MLPRCYKALSSTRPATATRHLSHEFGRWPTVDHKAGYAVEGCSGWRAQRPPNMVIDHIDLRVADVATARLFYDAFLKAFGFRGQRQTNGDIIYYRFAERRVQEAVALIEAADHVANEVRLAFHASKPEDVDRIATIALNAGALKFEPPQWCPEIAERYYAAFFEDPSGNRLEVVYR